MTTNILSLPLVSDQVETGTNEAWREAWAFEVAGSSIAIPEVTNTGNGTFTTIEVGPGTPIGNNTLRILSVVPDGTTAFELSDPDGDVIGLGTVGTPFNKLGFGFTLHQGAVAFVIGDTFTLAVLGVPIDLTGIFFSLAVRVEPSDANVRLSGSTADGLLINSASAGILSTAFPQDLVSQKLTPGTYGFDVLAVGDGIPRRVVTGTLTIVGGYSFTYS